MNECQSPKSQKSVSPTSASGMRRGRPIKYPRPPDCPHLDRAEHANGVCYQCSSNINNQRKREKKMREEQGLFTSVGAKRKDSDDPGGPKSKKKRRTGPVLPSFADYDPTFIEINVGGKIFATTMQTITKEMSMLPTLIEPSTGKFDSQGRSFVDRDPTHFRWILNYLRDTFLITLPQQQHERLELLQEAKFYQLNGLINLLEPGHGGLLTQSEPDPTFRTARPSAKGTFYLPDAKWAHIFPSINKDWYSIAVRFEEGRDEVVFLSFHMDMHTRQIVRSEDLCRGKLIVGTTAKAAIQVPHLSLTDGDSDVTTAEAEFWWEPSQTQYPQLHARFSNGTLQRKGPLDFYRTMAE